MFVFLFFYENRLIHWILWITRKSIESAFINMKKNKFNPSAFIMFCNA